MKQWLMVIALCGILAGCNSAPAENIKLYPDEALRTEAEQVKKISESELKTIEEMKTFLNDNLDASGLAANQLGVNKRFFVVRDFDRNKLIVMINPMILQSEGAQKHIESSVSVPGINAIINRSKSVTVIYQDVDMIKQKLIATGRTAQGIQQNIDQLNGVLIFDVAEQVIREG